MFCETKSENLRINQSIYIMKKQGKSVLLTFIFCTDELSAW